MRLPDDRRLYTAPCRMVHARFGPNGHREDAPHFIFNRLFIRYHHTESPSTDWSWIYLNITVSFWCVFKEVSDWLVLPMCRLFLAISVILKSHGNKLNNWFLSSSIIQWYIFSRNLRFFLNSPFSRSTSNESKLLNKAGGKYKKAQLTRLNNSSPQNNQYHQEQ